MTLPTAEELTELCGEIQKQIEPEFRAYADGDPDDPPGILLTVGAGPKGWSYQTGDPQFMGGAYHYPWWGQAAIHADTDCADAARQILDEIEDIAADYLDE